MQRDKRGRFVKKAYDGTILTINNLNWKVRQGAKKAYDAFIAGGGTGDFSTWASTPGQGFGYLEPAQSSSAGLNIGGLTTAQLQLADVTKNPLKLEKTWSTDDPTGLNTAQNQITSLDTHNMLFGDDQRWWAPDKIQYTVNDQGQYVDQSGNIISSLDLLNNTHRYSLQTPELENIMSGDYERNAGMHVIPPGQTNNKSAFKFDRNKAADFLEYARAGIGAAVNNKIAERALEAEKPFLQDISESHHNVYGDYRAKVRGEQAAAQLRNAASQPLTSDGALQQQMMLEAQIKGQEYIDSGNATDEATIKQTKEIAWQQEKENQQQRQAAAMANRQAMLMSQKNKSQIENMRDSANFSQVVSPLLAATEQRMRAKAAEQEAYQEQYDSALMANQVWNDPSIQLTDTQKALRNIYLDQGIEGVNAYVGTDTEKNSEWLRLSQLMKNETIKRQAALKGVHLNPASLNNPSDQYGIFGNSTPVGFKKGGTIYKAKLSKRTKDNDRGAKSIETSKKIAARFLEKAMDSLYTYDDIELIAKPKKKKRKYQSGGGLPFVNFTPVFASSETGAPTVPAATKSSDDDLASKDVLELLKDMDGLPSDMQIIVSSLKNFELSDQMDPLGLSSSSNITSRYISLINKIKVAKFNREEYNNAFNQLKGNGGLNEFAVTSEGLLIGTNKEGDFEYFTPDQVNAGEHQQAGYALLTNSNLLYLRANSTEAAFNHQLTTVAQNGIGMEVITKQVGDILQNLGSSKEQEEGFVKMGSKGSIINGIRFLQKAAQEVGDDTINENMSVADYYQAGYLTEDQAQQAQLALQYIWSALPQNAKSLLQVKGGGTKGAEAIIQSLVYSKTSTSTQFKASPKKMTKDGSGTSSDGVDELKLTPVQMMQVGYTDHMPVTLQRGTKYAMTVNAQVLPIVDVNKKTLGITTLDKVAESTFGGALDMNNVTMGSQLIDPHALQNVQIDSTNLYVMNLPIDKNSQDGTIKPDLAWMTKIEEIDRTIRDKGITDIAQINKLYTDAGLPVLMDDNGQLNVKDYCKFGVLNGHALNSAFKDLDLLDNTVIEIDDEDQIENIMNILNKGRNEKDRLDFDSKSWADSIFGTDHDSIFEGTIYIPIRTNAFTGMIGGGQYPDTETAAEVEALIQQKERTRGYVDPGLLN